MTWTPRQRAMLAEMGLSTWGTPAPCVLPTPPTAPLVTPPAQPKTRPAQQKVSLVQPTAPSASSVPSAALPIAQRESPLHQVDWAELQAMVSTCQACALCKTRTQSVVGGGSVRAHWLVVGEGPGEQEDLQGEPFVGKSGQLLDNMLRAIGCTRHDTFSDGREAPPSHQVYLANAVKCRPPGNRNPLPDELQKCQPYLQRQIELLQPRIIVAMGRFAVQSLLHSTEPIGRLRNRVHLCQGVPLVVTYHPAYLLRSPQDKAKAWVDLRLALRIAQGEDPSGAPNGLFSG